MTYKIINTSHKSITLNNGTRLKPYGFTYINDSDIDSKLNHLAKMAIVQITIASKTQSAEDIAKSAEKKKKRLSRIINLEKRVCGVLSKINLMLQIIVIQQIIIIQLIIKQLTILLLPILWICEIRITLVPLL